MINAIVFSKDRAAQLHLFLKSVEKNCPDIFRIHVLYKASSNQYNLAYEKLKGKNVKLKYEINWVSEGPDFKTDVLGLMDPNSEFCCFFTDDDIIYQPLDEEEVLYHLKDESVLCFSLRLGLNTIECYTMRASQDINAETLSDGKFIKWDWTAHSHDFGYPLSVDGNVYRTHEMKRQTEAINFVNPNTYEAQLTTRNVRACRFMVAYASSRLVNTPVNVVQSMFPNRKGEQFGYTAEELNTLFLDNQEISLGSLDFSNIVGCHQELKFGFIDGR